MSFSKNKIENKTETKKIEVAMFCYILLGEVPNWSILHQ